MGMSWLKLTGGGNGGRIGACGLTCLTHEGARIPGQLHQKAMPEPVWGLPMGRTKIELISGGRNEAKNS